MRLGIAALSLAAVLSACGGGPSGPAVTFNNEATPVPSDLSGIGLETPKAFVTAPPVASDVTVTINPKTYPSPDDPCYGLPKSVSLLSAPAACEAEWQMQGVTVIPGEDISQSSPIPRKVLIASGVPVDTGTAAALAFYRYEVLSTFLVLHNYTGANAVIDTPSYVKYDRILTEMLAGATVAEVPDCAEPTSLRVAPVPQSVHDYLTRVGWPQPSSYAVIANFSACPGITFVGQGNIRKQLFGNNAAATTITTGSIQDIAPFGKVWVMDGYGICGVAALKPVCGV